MATALRSLSPQEAWQPLPASEWDESAARHLLGRLGWSATPAETARALRDGPTATLQRTFAHPVAFPKPALIAQLEADGPELLRAMGRGDAEQRRLAAQDARERAREALADMTIHWLQLAAQPEHAPFEKWCLFLQDVWVVGAEKVKNSALIYQHQDWIRRGALGTAPLLAKALSRSPAMILYLDLQQSKAEAPNENFARELFELFTLGEGNYTETDIKQAARAFTGYRQVAGKFLFQRRQHDAGTKTVFGQTGNFTGDDVIDLVFQQKAAGTFLPREMVKFYLSENALPAEYTDALGAAWARQGYRFGALLGAFFGSRLFYAEEFRGNFIKSPLQYFLGLTQDLDLTPAPLARQVIGALRSMGQLPFNPPNVRGWVGGRNWINSATLASRRAVANALLNPLNEATLNADELFELDVAATNGVSNFTLAPARLDAWAKLPPADAARALLALALPSRHDPALADQLASFLAKGNPGAARARVRTALATLLESPDYQLC
ncbi:DUF1800 domain-containing protein [Oleiharenicola sp. Vm1]|uniref:DUF1800 domain-containing protein n=1 Tax=Oleiharenicola sp. Vm1 TaxID=3398393 RepID=UPI0039F5DB4D